jgi:hypothetical protein
MRVISSKVIRFIKVLSVIRIIRVILDNQSRTEPSNHARPDVRI